MEDGPKDTDTLDALSENRVAHRPGQFSSWPLRSHIQVVYRIHSLYLLPRRAHGMICQTPKVERIAAQGRAPLISV